MPYLQVAATKKAPVSDSKSKLEVVPHGEKVESENRDLGHSNIIVRSERFTPIKPSSRELELSELGSCSV